VARREDGRRVLRDLRRKAEVLTSDASSLQYVVAARETVTALPPDDDLRADRCRPAVPGW
jgi:hypothetical protein